MSQDRRKAADNRKKSFMINKVNNYPDLLPVMQNDVKIVTNKLEIREGDAGNNHSNVRNEKRIESDLALPRTNQPSQINGETIAEATSRSS